MEANAEKSGPTAFEQAYQAEQDIAARLEMEVYAQKLKESKRHQLLVWAKSKGLVPPDATELPDEATQQELVAEAGLPLTDPVPQTNPWFLKRLT